MDGIFLELENENALRSYPFAAGCIDIADADRAISPGVFIDAMLYPVNPSGVLYLSSISESGVFSVSDENGVIMSGTPSGNVVELYDTTPLTRHVGVLVASSQEALSEFAGRNLEREYSQSETAFASQCVFPVVVDGVTSVSVSGSDPATGELSFSNASTDDVRVSSGVYNDGRRTLRFDVLPRLSDSDEGSIRRIICVVDGQTPFRIEKHFSYNAVVLSLYGIDKDSVCAAAHREDSFEVSDTCSCNGPCEKKRPYNKALPETFLLEEVFVPPDPGGANGGNANGADNAFYLVVPNMINYGNPLSITLEDGVSSPRVVDQKVVFDGISVELAEGETLDDVTSKGVVLQVPGLGGGTV